MSYGPVSKKQKEVLEYIKKEILRRGFPPAVREICQAVGLKSTSSVHAHLESLEKAGYIRRERSKDDERIVMVYLTDSGKAFRTQVEEIPGQVGSCMTLEEKEAAQLYSLLYILLNSLE